MVDILKDLNDKQVEAVNFTEGPLLVLAGAGSGKTKTLTHRIANIIQSKKAYQNEILAVTFTNKAAREMRERLSIILDENNSRSFMPWMGTFHSICVRILRIDGKKNSIANNFVIYDEDDRKGLIKESMKKLSISEDEVKSSAASSMISGAKNKLVSAEEFIASANFPLQQKVGHIYQEYEKMRIKADALDFDDILLEVVSLFRQLPEVRQKWQKLFKYILIDEYQDTNKVQYNIIKLLINENRNICVVGDDWQSIYSWRGADFTNILNFEKDFPGAKVVKLEQNYRNTGAILKAAQNVINQNVNRTDKVLWTESGEGDPIEYINAYDADDEASRISDIIDSHVSIGAREYSDFAVFYRTNSQSYNIEKALIRRQIPSEIIGGIRFFDRAEIKDILAYLKLAYQPNDIASFKRIANVPKRSLGKTSLDRFIEWQQTSGMDIISALNNVEQSSSITPRAKKSFMALGDMFRVFQAKIMSKNLPSDIISSIVNKTNYADYINDGTPKAVERLENIDTLISEAKPYADIETYIEEVSLMSSADKKNSNGSVTLMTLHAAKGLEFPVVFMIGLEEGIFPHSRALDNPSEMEEERRLCYVGMTRAEKELYITSARSRIQFGQIQYNEPSRFLKDIDDSFSSKPEQNSNQEECFMDEIYEDEVFFFDVGDRVNSAAFGNGTIEDVDGMAVIVLFDNGTRRKLNVEYARLKKL